MGSRALRQQQWHGIVVTSQLYYTQAVYAYIFRSKCRIAATHSRIIYKDLPAILLRLISLSTYMRK